MIWKIKMNETKRLSHEYFLIKMTMKEGVFLYQVDGLTSFWIKKNGKDYAYSG